MVERGIRRLDAQQIAVSPGLPESLVLLTASLADGERDGKIELPDAAQDAAHDGHRKMHVLARLQDDGTIAVAFGLARELHDFILRQAVTLNLPVVAAQAAVAAVLPTDIRELNEAAQMHAVPDELMPHRIGSPCELFLRRCIAEQRHDFLPRQAVRLFSLYDKLLTLTGHSVLLSGRPSDVHPPFSARKAWRMRTCPA